MLYKSSVNSHLGCWMLVGFRKNPWKYSLCPASFSRLQCAPQNVELSRPSVERRGDRAELEAWSTSLPLPSSLADSGLSTETQTKCVPGPAARDAPGTVARKSQLQWPGNPQLCRANMQFFQPVGWMDIMASLPSKVAWEVWAVHVSKRCLRGPEELHWTPVLGKDTEVAPCASDASCLRGTGCGTGQVAAGTHTLCAGMSPFGSICFQQICFQNRSVFFGCCSSAGSSKSLWLSFGMRTKTRENQAWFSCYLASVFCKPGDQNNSSFKNQ